MNNFTKFTGNSCSGGSTCEFCKIIKSTFFKEQLRKTVSESGYCSNEARDVDCISCRELDAMLIASAKILERETYHPDFIDIYTTISHMY